MINIYQLLSLIISLLYLIYNSILILAIGFLWNLFIYPFLNPNVLFPSVLENGHIPSLNPIWYPPNSGIGYALLTQEGMDASVYLSTVILNYIVAPFFSIFLILSGLSYLFKHSFGYGERLRNYIPKIFISVILAYFSIYIADVVMIFGKTIYTFFYSGLHIVWSGKPSPVNGLISLAYWPWNYFSSPAFLIFSENSLLEFMVLVTLITIIFIFLIILVMRIVWIYFLIMFLPLASLLLMHPKTEMVGKRLWISFIDRVFEICFMAPLLILLIFVQDPLIWAGIFAVASVVPSIVSFSLANMGYPRSYSFFPRFFIFEDINIGKTAYRSVSKSLVSDFSLLPKESGKP
ncbi:MAG: hypothetical protein ACP5F1_00560 [Thermoplasmata archaeon]|nr:hypothetical protein [Thermoplasmata archaeon]